MNPTTPFFFKDNFLAFIDPSSKHTIEITTENKKLAYSIRTKNSFSKVPNHQIPNLLRQFANFSQLLAFFQNGNTIKTKKRGDQEYSLEVLLPCRGGVLGVPLIVLVATAGIGTGVALANNPWIIQSYVIQPFQELIRRCGLNRIRRPSGCDATQVAQFVFILALSWLCHISLNQRITNINLQGATELLTMLERFLNGRLGRALRMVKKGVKGQKALSRGFGLLRKLTVSFQDFLGFKRKCIKLAKLFGISEADLEGAFNWLYTQLEQVLPTIAVVQVPDIIRIFNPSQEERAAIMRIRRDSILRNEEQRMVWEDIESHEEEKTLEEDELVLVEDRSCQIRQEQQRRVKPKLKTLGEDRMIGSEKELEENFNKKIRLDEKIRVGKRMYLMYLRQGREVDRELMNQIKVFTELSDRSIEKLINKLKRKYPPNQKYNSENESQISGLSDLSFSSSSKSDLSFSLNDESSKLSISDRSEYLDLDELDESYEKKSSGLTQFFKSKTPEQIQLIRNGLNLK